MAMVTYHVHYKAPDVFGRIVARALRIPYVVIEGSRAPKRAGGAWAEGHRLAEQALDAADAILIMNPTDREMLDRFAPPGQMLVDFPPFVDTQGWPDLARRPRDSTAPLRLLTVAMMRPGDKLASYRQLAEALSLLPADLAWTLDIVGDGPAWPEVDALLSGFGDRVQFRGLVTERNELAAFYAAADLLVWPAVNEAFGMVFLEAALQGCPSLAGRHGGVAGVVKAGLTGELVPPDQPAAFAGALAALAGDEPRRDRLGRAARDFARNERRVENAAAVLGNLLRKLTTTQRAAAWG
jgi:glycosyltransferase involved in cell wall biosynthesis